MPEQWKSGLGAAKRAVLWVTLLLLMRPVCDPAGAYGQEATGDEVVQPSASQDRELMRLDVRSREITDEVMKLQRRLHLVREEALKGDAELRALAAEIRAKQEEFDKKLLEKSPALAEMTARKNLLIKEYEEIRARVRARKASRASTKGDESGQAQ